MAYEISEGAAAGALFLPNSDLQLMTRVGMTEKVIIPIMIKLHKKLQQHNVLLGGSASRYLTWFDKGNINLAKDKAFGMNKAAKLTAVVQGCSAALGIRKFMTEEGDKWSNSGVKVYVTGAAWDSDISFLRITVGGWQDYNSSDLVVVKGNCYYGVSLKKKEKESSANPTMINKSFVTLLESQEMKKYADKFLLAREKYFGKQVKNQMVLSKGALTGSTYQGISNKELFYSKIWNPIKTPPKWVYLVNLKGEGKLDLTGNHGKSSSNGGKEYKWTVQNKGEFILDSDGKAIIAEDEEDFKENEFVHRLFGYHDESNVPKTRTDWKMKQNINAELKEIKKISNIFQKIQKLVVDEKLAKVIGKYLVSAVLKTELQGATAKQIAEMKKGKHFGFALITALGAVKTTGKGAKKVTKITSGGTTAIVKTNPTMQQAISNLFEGHSRWEMILAENPTKSGAEEQAKDDEDSTAAKIFFDVGVGKTGDFTDLLNMEIRYKGDFVSSPQFLGGISPLLDYILQNKDKKIEYKFGKACKGR